MSNHKGITLIELALIIVVLASASLLLLRITSQTSEQTARTLVDNQVRLIARSTMANVVNKPLFDPDDFSCSPRPAFCPTPEADWQSYDNVCDFDGYQGPPLTRYASNLNGYTVRINIDQNAALAGIDNSSDNNLLAVEVQVTGPGNRQIRLHGWRLALEHLGC